MSNFRLDQDRAAAELVAQYRPIMERALVAGLRNYLAVYALTAVAVVASIAAGALGIFEAAPARIVGVVALVPAAATLAMRSFKWQARANLHYEFAADVKAILTRATFSQAVADDAGTLATELAERERRRAADWVRLVGFDDQLPRVAAPPS